MISTLRELAEIAFYALIGTLTVLTYLKARLTILQPFRAEVFKEQVKILSELLELLGNSSEGELRDKFEIREAIIANACSMMDRYVELNFDVEVERKDSPYSSPRCREFLFDPATRVRTNVYIKEAASAPIRETTREEKLQQWRAYKHNPVCVPIGTSESVEKFQKLAQSPLIPSDCATLIKTLIGQVRENISKIGPLLTDVAKELQDKYPTLDKTERADFMWIYNRYNGVLVPLAPICEQIAVYIRQYFGSDVLLRDK